MNLKRMSAAKLDEQRRALNFWISGRWAGQAFMRDCESQRDKIQAELDRRAKRKRQNMGGGVANG